MKLIANETSLVIAGTWNPAILTPDWVVRHALQRDPEGQMIVQAEMDVGSVYQFPRFSLQDFMYLARPDVLILSPSTISEDAFRLVEDCANRTLEQLTHTPITGIGHNFEFQEDAPEAGALQALNVAQQDIVDAAPDDCTVASSVVITSLNRGPVKINIQRYFDGVLLGIKFNFHHSVNSAAEAAQVLTGQNGNERLYQNYIFARQLIEQLYGEIENVEDGQ